jgi:uncharacterized protein YbjQ (UPF0145 family)
METDLEQEILISTADSVPGRSVRRVIGLVRGSSVRVRAFGRDLQALGRTVVGGRVGVYTELLEETRAEAIELMKEQAREAGANAVLAFRMTTSQVMNNAAEVLAYGTAVELD